MPIYITHCTDLASPSAPSADGLGHFADINSIIGEECFASYILAGISSRLLKTITWQHLCNNILYYILFSEKLITI